MRSQKLTGKFPTERPPDPDNRNPGTVGTVTGAEIQISVLPRTTPKYRNRHASVQPAALSACDRQDRIGSIAEHDGEHHACDVTLTPLEAVRQKCLWCCSGSTHEVALCPTKACPSWPFRFGRKPTAEIIAEQADTVRSAGQSGLKASSTDSAGGDDEHYRVVGMDTVGPMENNDGRL